MLMTLVRKQFRECFRSYFINMKTGKKRSKAGMTGLFVLFAVLMVFLGGMFFGVAFMMEDLLTIPGMSWLYFALMGTIAVLLGAFGSVFNTYAALYLAKDNELLLSMPIPPRMILIARMTLVYGLSLLYSSLVWIPAIVFFWIFGNASATAVVFDVLLIFLIALFVTVITCVLGWAVALISSRLKNRNILVVVLSLIFVGGYYYLCANMSQFFMSIVTNAEAIGDGIRTWGNVLYQLGLAGCGDGKAMLIFSGLTLALLALCFGVLTVSFLRIVTRTQGTVKKSAKITVHSSGIGAALFRRELKHFTSSPTYMLNDGLGLVMLLLAAGVSVVKRDLLVNTVSGLLLFLPNASDYLPAAACMVVCMMSGMNMISTPSVSLEGKTLWILQCLPVSGRQVLHAKLQLHVLLNAVPAGIALAALAWCFSLPLESALLAAAYTLAMIVFMGAFGLVLGVLRPNLRWTSETTVIKQSLTVLASMLVGWAVPLLTGAAFYFLRDFMDVTEVLTAATILIAFAAAALIRWLFTKGAAIFEKL